MGVFEINLDTGVGTLREDFGGVMGPDGRAVARSNWDVERGRWRVSARRNVGSEQIWTSGDNMIDTPSLLGYGRTSGTVLIAVPGDGRDDVYDVALDGSAATQLEFDVEGDISPIHHGLTGRLLRFSNTEANSYDCMFIDQDLA